MSRVGRLPVKLPAGVEVKIDDHLVEVKGPKGKLSREIHPEMQIAQEDNTLYITRPSDEKKHRALHGLTRSLVQNMVIGVDKGFSKSLELVGVGYRAALQGKKLVLNIGYSHQVEIEPEEGLEIEVPAVSKIVVKGIDKEKVGALAAQIRSVRSPEPYKGKGIKYENEVIRRKAGKAGIKA
ncbi:MAG: 50S ribosomal protein L6 [Syntrophaceticus sp.]|nr:50S ribosomal protein L6 [Syntrophaceticus sp.]MDD3314110.1 50S ribosomal protein L6 [Syntrophaceticus sp.]MDD4360248.1 50S ribosomal protein L6 [Syntrophaceticus sp.]MDD4782173.1 50S ribosomal protein L6 [Syntrophaceticus sp.]